MKTKKVKIDAHGLLKKVKLANPVVHHLTNLVTIYDCANIVKALGAVINGNPVCQMMDKLGYHL